MKANLYVDGFNLYYSALRRRFTDCKWLDLRVLCNVIFPDDELNRVRYFTARISARPDDPQQATRQQMYLRALEATDVEVHYGQFRHDRRWLRRATPCSAPVCPTGESVEILYTEEKGSDVNLAAYLLRDAAMNDCELAIVLTNDTDLVQPIRMARDEFGLHTALLCPSDRPARELVRAVDVIKRIRHGALQASQLPADLRDHKGNIHRPRAWRPEPEKR